MSLLFALLLQYAFAAEESRLSAPLLNQKKFEEDRRITDIELKAEAGSLSRYSLKADLNYSGPPVNDLGDAEMPNPDNRARNNKTSLSGYAGLRVRLTPRDGINLSTGLRWFAPYQSLAGEKVDLRPGEKTFDTASPQLSYDHTTRAGRLQYRTAAKTSVTTDAFYKNRGQIGQLGAEEFLKYNLGDSRWVAGLLVDASVFLFDRPYREGDGRVSNYFLSFIPSLEYKVSDRFNLKTSMAHSFANARLFGNWSTWERQQLTQRLGFGWAITRDVYVNPFLNYYVEHPALDTTALSMSTVFSIF